MTEWLPSHLMSHIFEFDPTYREIFSNHVLPQVLPECWRRWKLNVQNAFEHRLYMSTLCAEMMRPYLLFTRMRELAYLDKLMKYSELVYHAHLESIFC